MCVIIIKPRGAKLPTKKELKMAFARNHDGCGFVSERDTYKSLHFEDFWRRVKNVGKDENCIIHFRWATHGSVCLSNCHPFRDSKTHTFFAHNGILAVRPKGDMTDSETAFRKYLAPALSHHDIYSPAFASLVNQIIGSSKFAFMQDGELRVFGDFYKYGGCYYSNLHHLRTPYYRWAM